MTTMLSASPASPTRPTPPLSAAAHAAMASPRWGAAANVTGVLQAIEWQYRQPIVSLREALLQLRLLDATTLDALQREDPSLLRSRSTELVQRLLLTDDEWHRALARVAGLVEVEVLGFDVERSAFDILPLHQARDLQVVPLGLAEERFFVASHKPTSSELQQRLCSMTGHSIVLVWASSEAIERRLALQQRVAQAASGLQGANALTNAIQRSMFQPHGASDHLPDNPLDALVMQAMVEVGSGAEAEQLASVSESAGMVRLVNSMIAEAQRAHASDIHIEANAGDALTAIRFRRDGELELYQKIPPQLRAAMVSRIKVMARLLASL